MSQVVIYIVGKLSQVGRTMKMLSQQLFFLFIYRVKGVASPFIFFLSTYLVICWILKATFQPLDVNYLQPLYLHFPMTNHHFGYIEPLKIVTLHPSSFNMYPSCCNHVFPLLFPSNLPGTFVFHVLFQATRKPTNIQLQASKQTIKQPPTSKHLTSNAIQQTSKQV